MLMLAKEWLLVTAIGLYLLEYLKYDIGILLSM